MRQNHDVLPKASPNRLGIFAANFIQAQNMALGLPLSPHFLPKMLKIRRSKLGKSVVSACERVATVALAVYLTFASFCRLSYVAIANAVLYHLPGPPLADNQSTATVTHLCKLRLGKKVKGYRLARGPFFPPANDGRP
ncbi:hypothetical protein BaRGS_00005822 [Batillaria attramentaria]|uniref:Uncharacterized protein n=1 Tax=Batillaria attramentaria TaxID=370345 RepID=A0ABD0LUJ7_9CAEN